MKRYCIKVKNLGIILDVMSSTPRSTHATGFKLFCFKKWQPFKFHLILGMLTALNNFILVINLFIKTKPSMLELIRDKTRVCKINIMLT